MKCPICQAVLHEQKPGYLICPSGHGLLVSGKYLLSQNLAQLKDEEIKSALPQDRTKNITCPNCGHQMQKTNYDDSGIVIDACTNCPYRWLDTGEVDRLKVRKPHMKPEDLLFVEEINEEIAKTKPDKEINPQTPYFNLERVFVSGNEERTLAAITANGIYGIIKGAFTSWFMRIAILIIFGVTALLIIYIIHTFNQ